MQVTFTYIVRIDSSTTSVISCLLYSCSTVPLHLCVLPVAYMHAPVRTSITLHAPLLEPLYVLQYHTIRVCLLYCLPHCMPTRHPAVSRHINSQRRDQHKMLASGESQRRSHID